MATSTKPASRLGSVLGGTYRLDRVIGEGGMGSVYEAAHLRVPRLFAVKLLNPEVVGNRTIFERFQREAEIVGGLGHEHIVQVFDFNFDDDGVPYMVLELLKGEDLSRRIARGPLSVAQTGRIVDDVTKALEAAHARGIVHRDLKPQNIFLCRQGDRDDFVKVLDFGISKIVHSLSSATRTGSLLGTPSYMAPEQAEGRPSDIDGRTDLFALGTIVYECLTGKKAFDAPTPVGTIYQVCHADPPAIRSFAPDVPEALDQVIRRAIKKARDDRYASAIELREEFRSAMSAPVVAPPDLSGYTRLLDRAELARDPAAPRPAVVQRTERVRGRLSVALAPAGRRTLEQLGKRAPWIAGGAIVGLAITIGLVSRSHRPPPVPPPAPAPVVEPVPALSPPPPPEPPPAPAPFEVHLKLRPADARVELDGTQRVDNPLRIDRESVAHRLVVSAPGYASEARTLRLAGDTQLSITLTPLKKPRRPNKPNYGPLEKDL